MRRIAYAMFILAGVLTVLAFVLWGAAILRGSGPLGWLGALEIVLAIIVAFVGAGLMDTVTKREQR